MKNDQITDTYDDYEEDQVLNIYKQPQQNSNSDSNRVCHAKGKTY